MPDRADIHIVSARATSEPQTGSRLLNPIGDAIATALPGRTTYTELAYPASTDFAVSTAQGVTNLVELLNESSEREFVLLGYSQGAQVIGEALVPPHRRQVGRDAGEVSDAAVSRIAAILFYGDPRFTDGEPFNTGTFEPGRESANPRPAGVLTRYTDRIRSFCAKDDIACQGSGGNYFAHVSYLTNSMPEDGVRFVLQRLGG